MPKECPRHSVMALKKRKTKNPAQLQQKTGAATPPAVIVNHHMDLTGNHRTLPLAGSVFGPAMTVGTSWRMVWRYWMWLNPRPNLVWTMWPQGRGDALFSRPPAEPTTAA